MRRPRRPSLRLRLFVLILSPLMVMALLLGYWRFTVAQQTAEELFDRGLLAAALAISRDVAISGGDLLSLSTRDLIRDASGGEVFYHATGPGGIYITGYAYPPASTGQAEANTYIPQFFEASYREEPVRVLRVTERTTFESLTGDATVTVWQRISDRRAFANELAVRAISLIGALMATLALVVWFGVERGLRPLTDLQEAIARRSPKDLSRIKRSVPAEAKGIVRTLNRLLGQVEHSIEAHQSFISDAAHQLRNPAAAVQSMAESVRDARTDQDREQRVTELVAAARQSARIAEQLLSLERLRQPGQDLAQESFDIGQLVQDICAEMGADVLSAGVAFAYDAPQATVTVQGDRVFLSEAIKNLIDNAMKHGGSALGRIEVRLRQTDAHAQLTVWDDGLDLQPDQADFLFSRFSQATPSDGSGLGLAIAQSVAQRHKGKLRIDTVESGASLTLELPLS